jgi:hypothetical protein
MLICKMLICKTVIWHMLTRLRASGWLHDNVMVYFSMLLFHPGTRLSRRPSIWWGLQSAEEGE